VPIQGALAQSSSTSTVISGTVQDQTGGTLVGAIVEILRTDGGREQLAPADSAGVFRATGGETIGVERSQEQQRQYHTSPGTGRERDKGRRRS